MSATTVAPTGGSRLTPRPRSRARRIKNAIATVLISLAFVVALVPLVFIVAYVVQRGSELFGWDFLTQPPPFSERLPGGGMGPAVAGTLLITGAASLMAIPLGVLGGIYLNENLHFSLETQTRPTYTKGVEILTVVHETAHQWFGDSVSLKDWSDICLNECLASYAQWLWAEREGQNLDDRFQAAVGIFENSTDFWSRKLTYMGAGHEFEGVYDHQYDSGYPVKAGVRANFRYF